MNVLPILSCCSLLCIFGILVMHTFAGIDTAASPGNMLANVFANSLFNTGVTCFILLSGYLAYVLT